MATTCPCCTRCPSLTKSCCTRELPDKPAGAESLTTSPLGSKRPMAVILLGTGATDTAEVNFFNCSILAVAKNPAAIATGKATAILNQIFGCSRAFSGDFDFSFTLDMIFNLFI